MNERGYHLLQETIERLLRRNAYFHLTKVLNKAHPADIAHLLTLLNDRSARSVFENLPAKEIAAHVLSEMEPGFRSGRGATAPKRDFPFTFPDCYAQQELM